MSFPCYCNACPPPPSWCKLLWHTRAHLIATSASMAPVVFAWLAAYHAAGRLGQVHVVDFSCEIKIMEAAESAGLEKESVNSMRVRKDDGEAFAEYLDQQLVKGEEEGGAEGPADSSCRRYDTRQEEGASRKGPVNTAGHLQAREE